MQSIFSGKSFSKQFTDYLDITRADYMLREKDIDSMIKIAFRKNESNADSYFKIKYPLFRFNYSSLLLKYFSSSRFGTKFEQLVAQNKQY